MGEFLKVLPFERAKQLIIDHFPDTQAEYLPLEECNQRILSDNIMSPEDIPSFTRSTVDGYAVNAEDSFGSSESMPGFLEFIGSVEMGKAPLFSIGIGQCAWIPTGGMLPGGSNAAVMIEYTEKLGDDTILLSRPVGPWENVMQKGEDIAEGTLVFESGLELKSHHIGLLASLGIANIHVTKPYKVGVISTGDEIIPLQQIPQVGEIRDVNSYALAAAIKSCGSVPQCYPIVKDNFDSLKNAIETALGENDLIILSGGSSVGVADYSLEVMLSFPDSEMLFHGIAVKPGKPTMAVRAGKKLMIGLPGHPVSALMAFNIICRPAMQPGTLRYVDAKMTVNIASQAGRDDFIPVRIIEDENGRSAQPLLGKSGLMSILARSDGYIHIPYEQQGIKAQDLVSVCLW